MMTDDEVDQYIKALTAYNLATSNFLHSVRRVINLISFGNALCDVPYACKCRVILFANYDSQERRGTVEDIAGTRVEWKR